MAKQSSEKKGGGNKKHGKNTLKCQRYVAHKQREKNKLKRIIKSNGIEFAKVWAKENGVMLPKSHPSF